MLKIGLTGGIGSGKTTVANLFAEQGAPVIDADEISRFLVEPGQPALARIIKQFGARVLKKNGTLDRKRLKDIVFSCPEQKKLLESMIHPLVYQEMRKRIETLNSTYVILCIPLLLETKMESFVDRVLVVDCPVETQFNRVKERDQLSEHIISLIILSQVSREKRISSANDIIENTGDASQLADKVKKLHNSYISMSISSAGKVNL